MEYNNDSNNNEIIVCRKLEFYPVGDNRKDFYEFFREDCYGQTKAKQFVYNWMMQKEVVIESIKHIDEAYNTDLLKLTDKVNTDLKQLQNEMGKEVKSNEKCKKLKEALDKSTKKRQAFMKKRTSSAFKEFSESIGYGELTEIDKVAGAATDYDGLPLKDKVNYKTHFNVGAQSALKDYKNDRVELLKGSRSPRIYDTYNTLSIRESGNKMEITDFHKEGTKYYANFTSKFKMCFNLGAHPSKAGQARQTLDDIINDNPSFVKLCDSKVQKKGSKYYLLLSMKIIPQRNFLDPKKILGLDLGMDIPACGVLLANPQYARNFGNKKELLNYRTKIKALKDLEKHRAVFSKGGHGRKRKLRNNRLEALKDKEANFAKTYNHTISRMIIDYATKNGVGTIRMEDLTSAGFKDSEDKSKNKVLANWSYYDLQSDIAYKAEIAGIAVEKVNPAYTSKTCSFCGHIKEDFTLGNRDGKDGRQFHCSKCGNELNCDHNAAINIAKGGVKIPKKTSDK